MVAGRSILVCCAVLISAGCSGGGTIDRTISPADAGGRDDAGGDGETPGPDSGEWEASPDDASGDGSEGRTVRWVREVGMGEVFALAADGDAMVVAERLFPGADLGTGPEYSSALVVAKLYHARAELEAGAVGWHGQA